MIDSKRYGWVVQVEVEPNIWVTQWETRTYVEAHAHEMAKRTRYPGRVRRCDLVVLDDE